MSPKPTVVVVMTTKYMESMKDRFGEKRYVKQSDPRAIQPSRAMTAMTNERCLLVRPEPFRRKFVVRK